MVPDRDVLAVVLHDAVCPDRRCDPQVFGDEFKRADALLASDWLVAITAERDALAAKVAAVDALVSEAEGATVHTYGRWFNGEKIHQNVSAGPLRAALTEDAS